MWISVKSFKYSLVLATLIILSGITTGTGANNEQLSPDLTSGTIYYVANKGDDNNPGTSKDKAWQTISKVNHYGKNTGFKAGDRICFKGGDKFSDAVLTIVNSGEKDKPIVFTSFGEGKPHLTMSGISHNEIIQVINQKYFTIENLEISNPDFDMSKITRGIRIEITKDGEYPGITIRNNHIHDIHGGMWKNRHLRGGIWMRSQNNVNGFTSGMLVENNRIERCHTRGIKLDAQGTAFHRNMIVRNNFVENTGQAGIVIGHVKDGLIEGNTVYRAGNYYPEGDQAGVLAACWAAHSQNIIIQYNEVAYTKLGNTNRPDGNLNEMSHDSQAFDIDVTAPGWHLIQYNYTHDNEGGFFLWMGKPGPEFEWAVIRYNLSVNDGKGFDNRLFELHSHQDSSTYPVYVYNNTFVNDDRIWVNNRNPVDNNHKGWVFENNIFHAPDLKFDDQVSINYSNNIYWPGNGPANDNQAMHVNPQFSNPEDHAGGWQAIVVGAADLPVLDALPQIEDLPPFVSPCDRSLCIPAFHLVSEPFRDAR